MEKPYYMEECILAVTDLEVSVCPRTLTNADLDVDREQHPFIRSSIRNSCCHFVSPGCDLK